MSDKAFTIVSKNNQVMRPGYYPETEIHEYDDRFLLIDEGFEILCPALAQFGFKTFFPGKVFQIRDERAFYCIAVDNFADLMLICLYAIKSHC
ncbi:MAG: hypothetical protein ACLP9S_16410 [Syntrophales bacterium]